MKNHLQNANLKITIEKDIPIPNDPREPLPLLKMKVGDSFAVPVKHAAHVRGYISNKKKSGALNGHDYTTRTSGSDIRVWRIK